MNKEFYFLEFDYKEKEAKKIFKDTVAKHIPIFKIENLLILS